VVVLSGRRSKVLPAIGRPCRGRGIPCGAGAPRGAHARIAPILRPRHLHFYRPKGFTMYPPFFRFCPVSAGLCGHTLLWSHAFAGHVPGDSGAKWRVEM